MSVKLMGMVFDAIGFTSTQKLVLLALADHANEDGKSIYPSVELLSSKTALKERVIRKTLSELRSRTGLNVLRIIKKSTFHSTTEYAINVRILKSMVMERPALSAPHDEEDLHSVPDRPALSAGRGALSAERPALSAPKPSLTTIEPPVEPPGFAAAAAGIIREYENNISMVTPIMRDTIIDALKEYPEEWIHEAIAESVKANVRRWPYIKAILERWKRDGYKASKLDAQDVKPLFDPFASLVAMMESRNAKPNTP